MKEATTGSTQQFVAGITASYLNLIDLRTLIKVIPERVEESIREGRTRFIHIAGQAVAPNDSLRRLEICVTFSKYLQLAVDAYHNGTYDSFLADLKARYGSSYPAFQSQFESSVTALYSQILAQPPLQNNRDERDACQPQALFTIDNLRFALHHEIDKVNCDMHSSGCVSAICEYAERQVNRPLYKGNRRNLQDFSLSAYAQLYAYPKRDELAALLEPLSNEVTDTHHLGLIPAFLISLAKKCDSGIYLKLLSNNPKAIVRLFTEYHLSDFKLPDDLDGEVDYIKLLHKELCDLLTDSLALDRQVNSFNSLYYNYSYEAGYRAYPYFAEQVDRALYEGLVICPLLNWNTYDSTQHEKWSNKEDRHAILIIGKKDKSYEVYDPAYPKGESIQLVPLNRVYENLHNGQYIVFGCDFSATTAQNKAHSI